MPYLSLGFTLSQFITPEACALALWKALLNRCELKPRFRIHRHKLIEHFSFHFCDFISWIMGAAHFMAQMTEPSRSVDSVLSNYPVNMINGDSKNEHTLGHRGLRLGNHIKNLWKKCSFEGIKLWRISCFSPLPPYVFGPHVPPPAPGVDQYFCRSSFLVIWQIVLSVWITSNFLSIRKMRLILLLKPDDKVLTKQSAWWPMVRAERKESLI